MLVNTINVYDTTRWHQTESCTFYPYDATKYVYKKSSGILV